MKNIFEPLKKCPKGNYEIINVTDEYVTVKTLLQGVCPYCGHTTYYGYKIITIPRKVHDSYVNRIKKFFEEILK